MSMSDDYAPQFGNFTEDDWYTWYPVKLTSNRWAWLETVRRVKQYDATIYTELKSARSPGFNETAKALAETIAGSYPTVGDIVAKKGPEDPTGWVLSGRVIEVQQKPKRPYKKNVKKALKKAAKKTPQEPKRKPGRPKKVKT